MKIIDISLPITESLVVWPGEQGLRVTTVRAFPQDPVHVSDLAIGAHTGTHVDAPMHFLPNGKPLEKVPLDNLVGPCRVLNVQEGRRKKEEVKLEDLKPFNIKKGERLLFNLGNGARLLKKEFDQNYIAIGNDAARFLAAQKTKLVGVDYLSVERRGNPGHPVHVSLLKAGTAIVEGLNLRNVKPGNYTLVCLPLRMVGVEASPVRAILMK